VPRFKKILLVLLPLILSVYGGCSGKEIDASLPPASLLVQCQKLGQKNKHEKAINCLETLKGRYPGSPEAIEADLYIADNQFRQKEYLLATETYRNFIKLNPVHPKLDYAYYRTGLSYLKETPKAIDRDQQYLDDAINYFEILLKYYPYSQYTEINKEKWEEARRRVASRIYYVGRFYYRTGEYIAAIPRFEEVYQNYPALGIDEQALYYLALSHIKLSQKTEALGIFNILESRFPAGRYAKRLTGKLGL